MIHIAVFTMRSIAVTLKFKTYFASPQFEVSTSHFFSILSASFVSSGALVLGFLFLYTGSPLFSTTLPVASAVLRRKSEQDE
jgi:hypothetical protein